MIFLWYGSAKISVFFDVESEAKKQFLYKGILLHCSDYHFVIRLTSLIILTNNIS